MNRTTVPLVIAKAALGASLALGFAAAPHSVAHSGYDAYAAEVGDDNADGRIDEDESGWDCATMGNKVCGDPILSGYPRDCTVTDSAGRRADFSVECDAAWDGDDYVGSYN